MNILHLSRYRLDFFGQFVSMYLFFFTLFFGGKAILENIGGRGIGAFGATLDAVIVGWFLWSIVQASYSSLSSMISQESRWGTLEQLYMSPHGFGTIIIVKLAVNVVLAVSTGTAFLLLMLVTTGRSLTLDTISIAPIIILTVLSVVGIGFVLAGFTLIYKKLTNISNLMQFVIVGLIAAPAADNRLLHLLPAVQGSAMLQEVMRHNIRLWDFPLFDLSVLLGTAIFYSLTGYAVFLYCSREARKRGVMGHY